MNTGKLPLRYLGFIIAGAAAEARENFRWIGAMLPNLAQLAGLSIAQNIETPIPVRNADWSHLARGRGHSDAIRHGLRELNRHRWRQCAQNRQSAFHSRKPTGSCRPPYQEGFTPQKRGSENKQGRFEDSRKVWEPHGNEQGKRARSQERASPPAKKERNVD